MYMDLSLGTLVEATQAVHEEEHQEEEQCQEPEDHLYQQRQVLGRDRQHGDDGDGDGERSGAVERREHMFDKVLTPSDVGKLNRLVVPKQHAERFFPAAGAGTQLCFEDRASVPWRFRYSYWGSSQSYVMTKGWSRFVRAARLAAGDTVSFSRAACGRYFIDYRHCQRRRRDINFGDAAATVPAAWPLLDCMQRTTAGGSRGATMTTVDTVPVAGHHVEVEPTGTRCFRLFGVDVECGGDDLAAEEEYADGDSQSP